MRERQRLGSLRNLAVQPATRVRYEKDLNRFLTFLHDEGLQLPTRREWSTSSISGSRGKGEVWPPMPWHRYKISMQKFGGSSRLPGAWRLVKTWVTHELPNRAPPVPETVLHAMAGWALYRQRSPAVQFSYFYIVVFLYFFFGCF